MRDCKNCKHLIMYDYKNKSYSCESRECEFEPVEQEPRWIHVSERLPKAGEYIGGVARYYLVQNEYGDMLVARYTHSGYWEQIYQLKPIVDEIVAWMPLPQAYREVEEEQEPTTKNDLGVDAITMEQINKYVIEINKILEEEKDDARWCAGLRYSLRVLDKYCGKEQRDDTK